MKMIEVFIEAAQPGELAYGVVAVQRREGRRWRTIEYYLLRSDKLDTRRKMLLEDNERVVVEGRSNTDAVFLPHQNAAMSKRFEVTDTIVEEFAKELAQTSGPPPGPLPAGSESQIGVWREASGQDWSRTGARYRIY